MKRKPGERGKDTPHQPKPFVARWHHTPQVKVGRGRWRRAREITLVALPLVIMRPDGSIEGDGVVTFGEGKIARITS